MLKHPGNQWWRRHKFPINPEQLINRLREVCSAYLSAFKGVLIDLSTYFAAFIELKPYGFKTMVSVIFRDECGSVCVMPIYNRRVVYWLLQSSLDLKVAVTPVGSVKADTASSSLGGLIEISEDQQRKWAVVTGVKHYGNEMDRAKAWDDGIWGRPRKKAKMWVSVKIEKVVRVKKMGLEKLQREIITITQL